MVGSDGGIVDLALACPTAATIGAGGAPRPRCRELEALHPEFVRADVGHCNDGLGACRRSALRSRAHRCSEPQWCCRGGRHSALRPCPWGADGDLPEAECEATVLHPMSRACLLLVPACLTALCSEHGLICH
jgi:hypothetical protein